MEQKIDIVQEIVKIALDWLRKQGGQVVLLCGGLVFLYMTNTDQVAKLERKIEAQEVKIDAQANALFKCNEERAELAAEVFSLKMQLNFAFPKLRLFENKN